MRSSPPDFPTSALASPTRPAVYGAVLAALGLGGLVGSLVAGGTSAPRRFLPAMVTAWARACLPLALPAWTSSPWIIGAGLMLYGAGIGVGMVIWGTALQTHVPLVLAGVLAAAGQLRSEDVEMQPRFHTTRGGHFRHPVRNPEVWKVSAPVSTSRVSKGGRAEVSRGVGGVRACVAVSLGRWAFGCAVIDR
ncbi:hypothetical protein [Micrococcus endophyticus]|uniref:Uncharacterized protein n=1 Tax=Micrococcus endophyticus TaxID=455343 RepID=A0A7W9JKR4_9MICC|nr:hypothetical protein [Micrococcus endophyticus]